MRRDKARLERRLVWAGGPALAEIDYDSGSVRRLIDAMYRGPIDLTLIEFYLEAFAAHLDGEEVIRALPTTHCEGCGFSHVYTRHCPVIAKGADRLDGRRGEDVGLVDPGFIAREAMKKS